MPLPAQYLTERIGRKKIDKLGEIYAGGLEGLLLIYMIQLVICNVSTKSKNLSGSCSEFFDRKCFIDNWRE